MGVNFCGYRTFVTHRLLRLDSKKKIKKKVKKWNKKFANNKLDIENVTFSMNSWLGHIKHCNSYTLKKKIINKCDFYVNDSFYNKIETNLINDIENFKKETSTYNM